MSFFRNYVLSIREPADKQKNNVIKIFGQETKFILLDKIRKKTSISLVKYLISLKVDNWILLCEEKENHSPLISAMKVISLLIKSKRKWCIEGCSTPFILTRISCVNSIFSSVFRTIQIHSNRYKEEIFLRVLKNKNILSVKKKQKYVESIYYIHTNLCFGLRAGGSVGHVRGVLRGFKNHGIKVRYASIVKDSYLKSRYDTYNICFPQAFGSPPELNYYSLSKKIVKQLARDIKKHKPSFLYQRLSLGNCTGAILSRKLGIPLILEYNSSEALSKRPQGSELKFSGLALLAEEISLKDSYKIVTISTEEKSNLITRGIKKDKIIVHPNGVDVEQYNSARFSEKDRFKLRENLGLSLDDRVFTFIGTFGGWHGVDLLAEVISELVKNQNYFLDLFKIRFLFIGTGLGKEKVEETIASSGANKYCTFTGVVPQELGPFYLSISDAFLLPTRPNPDGSPFSGSPTKLFEYMAMEKPIIASDLGQISEVLHNGIKVGVLKESLEKGLNLPSSLSSLLFMPGSSLDLQEAIILLSKNYPTLKYMGKNSRKIATEKYTWSKHVSHILKRLNEEIDD